MATLLYLEILILSQIYIKNNFKFLHSKNPANSSPPQRHDMFCCSQKKLKTKIYLKREIVTFYALKTFLIH